MAKKLLIVSFHYPPVHGSSGIQRTLKFSTYLRELGWEPLILTVSPQAYERVSDDQMREIPSGMVVERAFARDAARSFSIRGRYFGWMAQPDRWLSWWPAAVARGLRMIRQHRPDAIMSTYPIATAHLIGLTLKRLTGLPWIADCRDSMTEPGYPADPLTWRTNRRLEASMARHCSRAIFTTPGTLEMYAQRYPEVPSTRWSLIENGYDEENFVEAERGFTAARLGAPNQITLLHSGILYPLERDPRPFFAALRGLKDKGAITAASLRVRLRATGSDAPYRTMLAEFGIADIVELAPPVSYREALQEMLRADGLLLFQGPMCNHQIPAKLYEYFRAGRPVFALTEHVGNTAQALRGAGCGHIVDIGQTAEIADGLQGFLLDLRNDDARGVPITHARQHSRRSRTVELARLLEEVSPAPSPSVLAT